MLTLGGVLTHLQYVQNKVYHKLAAIVQQIWCVDYCLAPAKNHLRLFLLGIHLVITQKSSNFILPFFHPFTLNQPCK